MMAVMCYSSWSPVLLLGRGPTFDTTHGSDTWLKALKVCIPNSKHMWETLDFIDKEAGGYDHLDLSMKLRLLNFLCDEVLGTEKIRNWFDDQNTKLTEQRKEAKERFATANDRTTIEEKFLKQKMCNDITKALIARNCVPLTIQERESVVYEIKKKSAQAHTEMLECKRMVPIERPDAVRTKPIFRDNKGHVYGRLKGYYDKSEILLQDIGNEDDTFDSSESWFKFDADQMTVIDKHIKALSRLQRRKI